MYNLRNSKVTGRKTVNMGSSELLKIDPEKLSAEEAGRAASQLRQEIHRHNYHYYIKDEPVIDDSEYDRLFRKLEQIEKKYPGRIQTYPGRIRAYPDLSRTYLC